MMASIITRALAASVVGALYGWVAVKFWGFYVENNAIAGWLIATFAERGHTVLFLAGVAAHDLLVNVVLASPFAFILVALRPLNRWLFVLLSALAGFVVANWNAEWSWWLASSTTFWSGIGMAFLSLPLAFAGIRALRKALSGEVRGTAA